MPKPIIAVRFVVEWALSIPLSAMKSGIMTTIGFVA
jgi:hypothetical protein